MIPGRLYDDTEIPPALIATVRLNPVRRFAPVTVPHKDDDGWLVRLDGDGSLEMRIIAEGIASQEWIANLHAIQLSKSSHDFRVEMDDGDSHSGMFMVEELSEQADADNRRRFRLVLLSDALVTYTPAVP